MSKKPTYVPRNGGRYERDSTDAKAVRVSGTEAVGQTEAKDKPDKKWEAAKDATRRGSK